MSCVKPFVVVVCVVVLSCASPLPTELPATATARPRIGDTIQQVTRQLIELNATSADNLTFDTRTPPKIKQKKKIKPETMENSHAGIAIPIDTDTILEETTKKLNFYKIEKPTTNSGLISTWILLSGHQVSSTSKPIRKPIEKETNTTVVIEPNRVIKPIFKKRVTSTTKAPTSSTPKSTTATSSTPSPKDITKLTKVKATMLANASKKAPTSTTISASTKKVGTTTVKSPTTPKNTTPNPTTTKLVATNSSTLPVEAKDGDTDLTEKTTRKPAGSAGNKKKKNKTRRRKPEKSDTSINNNTKIDKLKREKPIGTQLYNYLSREVMPTVGVGLVGLVVTAGLASYFLYPFGVARRSYDLDRKDKEGGYYYNNEYSGGIAEEEAIGKVIAGMPSNSLYGSTSYKAPNRLRNRQVGPTYDYQPISYPGQEVMERNKEAGYSVADEQEQQFVVGNTPKIEVTPAAVPEHGPRSLRLKRHVPNESENEIAGTTLDATTFESSTINYSTTTITTRPDPYNEFMFTLQNVLKTKISASLQFLHNVTQSLSNYVTKVQQRFKENNKTSG